MQPIDISNIPDLVKIVEDMKDAKEPRILKKGSAPVAMLMPLETSAGQRQESTGESLLRLAAIGGKGPTDLSTRIDDFLYGMAGLHDLGARLSDSLHQITSHSCNRTLFQTYILSPSATHF
jgi:hypothetical protein